MPDTSLDIGPVDDGDPHPGWAGRAAALLRIYSRAFLAQGAGLVGLAWCLAQTMPAVASGLIVLLLADQAIFLRGRPAIGPDTRLQFGIDAWCLFVSGVDLVLFFATLFRTVGLRDGAIPVTDIASCLAFAIATPARLDLGLLPVDGAGRLVAALEALLVDVALILAVVRVLLRRTEMATGS